MPHSKSSFVSVTFAMDAKVLDDLDRNRELYGIETRKEYFDYAFSLFNLALSQARSNKVLAFIDQHDGTYTEIVIPALIKAREYFDQTKKDN